jgi:cardiolipin synthase
MQILESRFTDNNDVELLRSGAEYFPTLEHEITLAQHEIYLQAYIFEADTQGNRVADLLKQAAQRGVKTRVLVDGFGSQHLPKSLIESFETAGVEFMFFRPHISPWTLQKSRLRRLHHKIVVIDQRMAFVGGINIIDDFNVPHRTPPRIDYAVNVKGEMVFEIHRYVQRLWRHVAWRHLKFTNSTINAPSTVSASANMSAAFVIRDNVLHRRDIEKAYLAAINAANCEIIIANAYFIPGRHFRKALIDAANRGVNVTLLLQGRMEYFLMLATHAFYSEFLQNGIKIYEYHKSFMHSKTAVIDEKWSTVGSSNIDPFSLLLAREANVVVKNQSFAEDLKQSILQDIQDGASQIKSNAWQHSHMLKRMISWVAYALVRSMIGVIENKSTQSKTLREK